MSGAMQNYVIPGLQTVGGAVSEFFAPGNPVGTQQLAQGIGKFAGEAAGGPAGGGGFVTPGSAGTPSIADTGAALSANPGTAGITPGMVTGVSPQSGPAGPTQASANPTMATDNSNILSGLGPVGKSYMDYITNMRLLKQKQKTDYAAPHSSAPGQTSPLALQPPMQFALPGSI